MPYTPAGWYVQAPGRTGLATITYLTGRKRFTAIVKRGAGGNISRAMLWLIMELDKIETLSEPGWEGCWAYRAVRGSSRWSEHAAGTALDWNASQHPLGGAQFAGWTPDQVFQIRRLLSSPRGRAFKWGADFVGRKDSMHFELRAPSTWRTRRSLYSAKAMRPYFIANNAKPW